MEFRIAKTEFLSAQQDVGEHRHRALAIGDALREAQRRTHQVQPGQGQAPGDGGREVLTGVDPEPRKLRPDSPLFRIRGIKSLRGEHPLEVLRCE